MAAAMASGAGIRLLSELASSEDDMMLLRAGRQKRLISLGAALLVVGSVASPAASSERYRLYRSAHVFGTSPVCPVGSRCQLPAADCAFGMSYCPRYLVCLDWLSVCPP
jgi:hypothetical protein